MSIITLTTDFGYRDPYLPAVKGYILSSVPDATLVDITHSIEPYSLIDASFILGGCYHEFPHGSIHIISIDAMDRTRNDDEEKPPKKIIAVKAGGHFFIAYDNGIVSLILGELPPEDIAEIPYKPQELVFPMRNIFAPAACKLAQGADIYALGAKRDAMLLLSTPQPAVMDTRITGSVMYIDNFGNCITNIHKDHIDEYGKGRKYAVQVKQNKYSKKININYHEAEPGDIICLFNNNGWLEVAMKNAIATKLLGLRLGDAVMVEFVG
ncbi:MAG: SAM-dependent chlorinase/fluorinase [Bacteroidetes bacterium]|nr:SAM-dependent chlorinase/fluorinase [Bacteroidota bacterium]